MRLKNSTICINKSARFNYTILETLIAGISLLGGEVKSMRSSSINIKESFVEKIKNEMFIINMHIPIYKYVTGADRKLYDTNRNRKLLLTKRQIEKLSSKVKTKGLTIIPLKAFFNEKSLIKIEIALCEGKKLHDKRADLKDKAIKMDIKQAYRGKT